MTETPSTGVRYEQKNLHEGHQYLKEGNILLPCPPSVDPLFLKADQEVITVLAKQMSRLVLEWDFSWVTKTGFGVRRPEVEAMRLVFKHTDVPVPEVIFTNFSPEGEVTDLSDPEGMIGMTIIPGTTLEKKWDSLDDEAKELICLQLWDLISKIRNIPRPQGFVGLYQCLADGSLSRDPMPEDLEKPGRSLLNDSELHSRIYERYLHCGGTRYENQLLDMLPTSEHSVFTHADIAPRNVMVDEQNNVTGILDWEWAGWYPEYWEYAQIMRPAFWGDWSVWMEKTAPRRWDLRGINAARKVLF